MTAPPFEIRFGRVGRPRGATPPKTPAERQAAKRRRHAAGGGRYFTIALDVKARCALERLVDSGRLPSQAAAVGIAVRYLERQMDLRLERVDLDG